MNRLKRKEYNRSDEEEDQSKKQKKSDSLSDDKYSKPSLQECAVCGIKKSAETKLMKCARCYSVAYCSKEHQKEHYKIHKVFCHEITKRIR